MKVKKYTIKPTSAWITPLRSDTLHGLIACHVCEWEGEKACKELLESFKDNPYYICSSAFPEDFIAFPMLPPIARERFSSLYQSKEKKELIGVLKQYKEFKKTSYIPFKVYEKYKDKLSLEVLFSEYCNNTWKIPKIHTQVEQHNTINRFTQTVDSGLFSHKLNVFEGNLDIYIKAQNHDFIEKYLDSIGNMGFGADSTVGKGQFRVLHDKTCDVTQAFEASGSHNLSLSVLSSEDLSELSGYYKTFTKKGRTWVGKSEKSPFKKPFIALEEGAVLESIPTNGVLTNIHKENDVVQLCHALSLPCTLNTTLGGGK